MTRPATRPSHRPSDPDRIANMLVQLVARRADITLDAQVSLTDRRLLVLALALAHPLCARGLAAFVRGVFTDPRFVRFERLRHRNAAYKLLHELTGFGLLDRGRDRDRVVFRLRPPVRWALREIVRS